MRIARTQHLGGGTRHPKGGARLDQEEKRGARVRSLEEQYQSLLQSQLELETSRDHYAELYHGAPACFVTLTQTGMIREINPAAIRLLNPSQGHFAGWPFIMFLATADKKHFVTHLARCRSSSATTESMSVELKLSRKPGEKPVFIELATMPPSQNEPALFKCVFRDITDIREMQEKRRWLAAIVESSADSIIAKDMDGRIISCNRGAEQLFGYTREELTGRTMTILIPPEIRHEETQILRRLRRGEKMESYETVRRRKDGTLVPVSLMISPIRDEEGRVMGISNFAHDISGRKEGARKLEEILKREKKAGRAGGDFLAALSSESLQRIIEEQETKNDQLNSANEEITASNEELQSTNEELETAREELESTNEALTTLNDELEGRNSELETVNNDLHDLLASVNIPIVILGADMKIRRFTAMAEKVFRLNAGDIGRPIMEIAQTLGIRTLDKQVQEVLSSLRSNDMEVKDWQGHWWSVRIGPYKTTARGIDGVVIALLDIDAIKAGVKQVKESGGAGI